MKPRTLLASLLLLPFLSPLVQADEHELAAAWKRHEVDFVYMGFTTRYSCEGLRDKVRSLLRHVGVSKGVKVTTRGCNVGRGFISDFPRLRVVFEAAEVPVTGQREVGEPILGQWRSVQLQRGEPRGLDVGDCELVEQFHDQLLSQMTLRSLHDRTNCVPHQLMGSRIDLKFELLVAAPTPDAPAQLRR